MDGRRGVDSQRGNHCSRPHEMDSVVGVFPDALAFRPSIIVGVVLGLLGAGHGCDLACD